MTLKNNKGFTLIELIVVMVIVAILGSVGYNAFSNYTANANITKFEQAFSDGRNAVNSKFAKSFTEGTVVWSVEAGNGVPDATNQQNGYLSGATLGPVAGLSAANITAAVPTITLNGVAVKIIDTGITAAGTAVPDAAFSGSTATQLVVVTENAAGTVDGTYYYKVTDNNVCSSVAFAEKPTTTSVRYVGAGANGCFIATPVAALKLMSR